MDGIEVVDGPEDVEPWGRAAPSWSSPPATSTVVANSTGPIDASEIAKSFRMRSCLPPLSGAPGDADLERRDDAETQNVEGDPIAWRENRPSRRPATSL
ncbi:MAG TPA: hypothetical protein VF743_04565 [Acidimicrobiales bacterium]